MKAYGQTSDAGAGLLRESWGNSSLTKGFASNSSEEYGWQKTDQQTVEFAPAIYGDVYSFNESTPKSE